MRSQILVPLIIAILAIGTIAWFLWMRYWFGIHTGVIFPKHEVKPITGYPYLVYYGDLEPLANKITTIGPCKALVDYVIEYIERKYNVTITDYYVTATSSEEIKPNVIATSCELHFNSTPYHPGWWFIYEVLENRNPVGVTVAICRSAPLPPGHPEKEHCELYTVDAKKVVVIGDFVKVGVSAPYFKAP